MRELSCSQIWNIEQEKDREKEKVGCRPAKLNEKKTDRDLEREIHSMSRAFPMSNYNVRSPLIRGITGWGKIFVKICFSATKLQNLIQTLKESFQQKVRPNSSVKKKSFRPTVGLIADYIN